MKQTAVDWIQSKILLRIGLDDNDIIELRNIVQQAKEKEEIQIKIAFEEGSQKEYHRFVNGEERNSFDSKNYYDEKYK
ncbi:MAG: hypothetical protein K9G64_09010 [Bacteroidia bacterium]|nr:hypothetical protein [Bacteroidia bacterium]